MKKILLAAAALVAGLAANAVGFDYSTTSLYDVDPATVYTNLSNLEISLGSAQTGHTYGKNSLNVLASGSASFQVGGILFEWDGGTSGSTMAKTYANYIQMNGSNRVVTIPTTAGDVVTVTVVDATAGVTVSGAAEGTSIDLAAGANTLTATGSSIVLTNGSAKPKYQAISVSGSSAVNEAAAEGAKEVVARVGLVNVYNDGSKELAK